MKVRVEMYSSRSLENFGPQKRSLCFNGKDIIGNSEKKKKNPNPLDQVIKNCDTLSDP